MKGGGQLMERKRKGEKSNEEKEERINQWRERRKYLLVHTYIDVILQASFSL
jgi:hypothetical protein